MKIIKENLEVCSVWYSVEIEYKNIKYRCSVEYFLGSTTPQGFMMESLEDGSEPTGKLAAELDYFAFTTFMNTDIWQKPNKFDESLNEIIH